MTIYPHRSRRYNAAELGYEIEKARKANKLTRHQLARETGLAPATITAVELGQKQASLETLIRVCTRLGMSLDEITRFKKVEPNALSIDELKLISFYRKVTPWGRKKAFQILELIAQ